MNTSLNVSEHMILEGIVREFKRVKEEIRWLDDLDTTSVENFKNSYGGGSWGYLQADCFADHFGVGGETPDLRFNELECNLLHEHFGICWSPHEEKVPERRKLIKGETERCSPHV